MKHPAICFILATISVVIADSHASGLDFRRYTLSFPFGLHSSANQQTALHYEEKAPSVSIPPHSYLEQAFTTGKNMGGFGIIGWITGAAFETVTIFGLGSNPTSESGSWSLITGILLEFLSPTLSCAGESIVSNAAANSNEHIHIQKAGWEYYGQSYVWFALSIGCYMFSFHTDSALPIIAGDLLMTTGMVYRGIAAIAPVVNMNKACRKLNISVSPIIDLDGNAGLAFSSIF